MKLKLRLIYEWEEPFNLENNKLFLEDKCTPEQLAHMLEQQIMDTTVYNMDYTMNKQSLGSDWNRLLEFNWVNDNAPKKLIV